MPDGYNCPFSKDLDFYYPHEAEWAALNDFLYDKERIYAVLGEMQYIYENTPEEDRYYNVRSAGFITLSEYYEGTYTLFPGIENLSGTEHTDRQTVPVSQARRSSVANSAPQQSIEQISLLDNLFNEPLAVLPSAEEQQIIIEQANQATAEANTPVVSLTVTQNDIDGFLLNIADEDKTRLAAQFADNPRSKQAVSLVREIYGDALNIPLPQAVRRITELVENGAFS